ncbi:unnamed protein product [Prorocentrum cordatum]|uniref:Uncharacterized protein n=1 Tax=Prorocentrum cordatum TaxID=2364126 RepID=A0ABN9RJF6_9DINO|nr:unnamed protein product [Polarella glacialis]
MAADTLSRLSFVNSHRGPGGRHQHDFSASSRFPPPRTQSLPHLASPAGFAPTLGNGSRQLYASLKVPYEAHLSATLHPNGTNWREPSAPRGRAAEEWVQPGRLRPETLGPAGRQQAGPGPIVCAGLAGAARRGPSPRAGWPPGAPLTGPRGASGASARGRRGHQSASSRHSQASIAEEPPMETVASSNALLEPQQRGKRIVRDNTNTLSHIGPLLYGLRDSRSDGLLRQSEVPMYEGSAGVNAKAERIPIYGPLPPDCVVGTFGPDHA